MPPLPAIFAIVRSQDWLAWRVADSSFEALGLWINLEGWGDVPLHHVAVEPAVGAHDDPDAAHREVTPLRSGADRRWRVVIEAGTGSAALRTLLRKATS